MVDWQTVKPEFEWDGSLRDLYVFETSEADWNRFLKSLGSWGYATQFSVDGEKATPPKSARQAFQIRMQAAPLLCIDLGGIGLNCHFFTNEELELDLDPREIDGPLKLGRLTSFMSRVGQALRRPVVLTPENCPEYPIIRYDPTTHETSYLPPENPA